MSIRNPVHWPKDPKRPTEVAGRVAYRENYDRIFAKKAEGGALEELKRHKDYVKHARTHTREELQAAYYGDAK